MTKQGIPTQFMFDKRIRDAAQLRLAAAKQALAAVTPDDLTGLGERSAEVVRELIGAIEALAAKNAQWREALEFISGLPDPGADRERSSTFYRAHAAQLKQIAAKALGKQTMSQEVLDWALEWWNSDESKQARATLENDHG